MYSDGEEGQTIFEESGVAGLAERQFVGKYGQSGQRTAFAANAAAFIADAAYVIGPRSVRRTDLRTQTRDVHRSAA